MNRSSLKDCLRLVAVAVVIFSTLAGTRATAGSVFQSLHSFARGNASDTDGSAPVCGLMLASNGNLYGTTSGGGIYRFGTVFEMTPSGTITTLHSFNKTDGAAPRASLIEGSDGNLYGTTMAGGSSGNGTIFKMTLSGNLTVMYNFSSRREEGASPDAPLIEGNNGDFYGTARNGGSAILADPYHYGFGTIFKISPTGKLTKLADFTGKNGKYPSGGLTRGSDGNLYGVTTWGGEADRGTVFKISSKGALSTLHTFSAIPSKEPHTNSDGAFPYGRLLLDGDGAFVGTTSDGGAAGSGTVFKMTSLGTITTLINFDQDSNGGQPYTGVIKGSDGDFYGITYDGGANGIGTVFKMTPSGNVITLHNFSGQDGEGANPRGMLVEVGAGKFFGTTEYMGANGGGMVYEISVSLDVGLLPDEKKLSMSALQAKEQMPARAVQKPSFAVIITA